MPQLDKKQAKSVDEQESGFAPLDEGIYYATLADVRSDEGPQGEYWIWEFTDLINTETNDMVPGRQWLNTSLSEKSQWKLKEVFDAFGVTPDTNTDLLLGKDCRIVVSQRTIEKGARVGDIGNQVDRVLSPVDEDEPAQA